MIRSHELGGCDHEVKRAPDPAVAGGVAPNQRDIAGLITDSSAKRPT
jgi:hypothetical protein